MILDQNGNPAPRKGNPVTQFWQWSTRAMHEGMERPGKACMGVFGIFCLLVGIVSISGGVTYLLWGRGTINAPLLDKLAETGENGGILGSIGQAIRRDAPRDGGIYDQE